MTPPAKEEKTNTAAVDNAKEVDDATQEIAKENNIVDDTLPKGEKILAGLGYISYFCILTLCLKKDSKFCQFHGKQGLALTLCMIPFQFIGMIFGAFSSVFPILISLLYFVIVVMIVLKVSRGEQWAVPGISKIAEQFKW